MTVSELIEQLSLYPADMLVYVNPNDNNGGIFDIQEVNGDEEVILEL